MELDYDPSRREFLKKLVGGLLAIYTKDLFDSLESRGNSRLWFSVADMGITQRVKTQEELRLESVIEAAYQRCFKTYEIAGRSMTIRMPFGYNYERYYNQRFYLGGKGDPEQLWAKIDLVLGSEEFNDYVTGLQQPDEKAIHFNLPEKTFSMSFDKGLIKDLKEGRYPGSKSQIYVLKEDSNVSQDDVYDFFYCIGEVGMDCSGFVYYIQKSIAAAYDVDLNQILAEILYTSGSNEMEFCPEMVPQSIGTWFYNPNGYNAEGVDDKIKNLRPGDIILFRGRQGIFRHSAVIQSIEFETGRIRYYQCTDWAPRSERGVHESFIHFYPSNLEISLKDKSVEWTQEVCDAFIGEHETGDWRNDGDRYRAYGGGVVVRLNVIRELIEDAEPSFYQ